MALLWFTFRLVLFEGVAVFSRFCYACLLATLLFVPSALTAQDEKAIEGGPPEAVIESSAASESDQHEKHDHIGEAGVSTDVAELSPPLAIYTFIMFLLLVAILWKFAWGPIAAALDKREENIRKDIDDAEAARVKAEQMLAAHAEKLNLVQDEVREIIAEARRDADHTKQEIINTAQTEAEATKHRAISEIDRAKDAALKELFDTIAARVTDATEHVLGRSLNSQDQERLIQEALSQFSEN
jgi:F-type H+-transporting ATPase subunit b